MFRGSVNAVTGKLEWVASDRDFASEDSDLSPELARSVVQQAWSQYGDMLHDVQRNKLYGRALERAIGRMRAAGREAHVLDIGTGTGLLAMMAARAGASKVTACEVMKPMVAIARQIIAANGFSDVIRVVPKRSTDMTEGDMRGGRANILVSEVFDTELIGEGALVTFAHAHQQLLERDCIVIPSSATLYVQLFQSEFLWSSHKLVPRKFPVPLRTPAAWAACSGAASLWDLHVEEVGGADLMQPLSRPVEVGRFPLGDPDLSPAHILAPTVVRIEGAGLAEGVGLVEGAGLAHGLIVWWSADMDGEELSMDPWNYTQWRDHWLQAVQLFPQPLTVAKGDGLSVACHHDDYCLWFTATKETHPDQPCSAKRPLCGCGMHTAWSRTRISSHNNLQRTQMYHHTLKQVLAGKTRVMCLGDGSLLPLLIAKSEIQSIQKIFVLENIPHSARVMRELVEENNLSGSITILTKLASDVTGTDLRGESIDAVVAEPHFSCSLLPWHNLHFWYACSALRPHFSPECEVVPSLASLKAIAVSFDNLYSLRAPVGTVEGLDLSVFDRMVGKSSTCEEGTEPEPHSLWEYPSYACSDVHELINFDLGSPVPESTNLLSSGEIVLGGGPGRPCHAVVLWMDYQLVANVLTSTGLLEVPARPCEKLSWDPSFKQAVSFLSPSCTESEAALCRLTYSVQFHTASGSLVLDFTGQQQ